MNEWQVVLVIIALAGLFATVGAPVLKLNATIAKLQASVDNLKKQYEASQAKSNETHDRQWEQIHSNTERLVNHEARIENLEKRE